MALDLGELVARATVDVSGMDKGISDAKSKLGKTGDDIDAAGQKSGGRFGSGLMGKVKSSVAGPLAGVVSGAAVLGAAKALYTIGAGFDDITDTIRVGTGATGKALDSLSESAKKVGTEIPTSFAEAGQTVADLNTRLGLTGPALETLSKQFIEAGRITGEAIDVKTMTAAFSAFNIKGADTSKAMDDIFQTSQATGVGMNELASLVTSNGAAFTGFGFTLSESAAWLGNLDKAGLDANKTTASLSRAMVQFAKEGKDPKKALGETVDQIKAYTDSGNDAAAIQLASKIFGTRGAGQFVAAVKSGAVNLDDLKGATKATSDTILKAADDTNDFAESWLMFKNNVLVKIEPVATAVFNALGGGMTYLTQHTPLLIGLGAAIGIVVGALVAMSLATRVVAGVTALQTVATQVAAAAQWALNSAMLANPIGLVVLAIALLVGGFILAYQHSETFRDIVQGALHAVGDAGTWLWNNALKPAFDGIKAAFDAVGTALSFLWDNIIRPVFKLWVDVWMTVVGALVHGAATAFGWVPGIGPKLKSAAAEFDKLRDRVDESLDGIGTEAEKYGSQWALGLARGIAKSGDVPIARAQGVANKIAAATRAAHDTHSPSRVAATIGRQWDEGMALGIDASAHLPAAAATRAARGMLGPSSPRVGGSALAAAGASVGGSGGAFVIHNVTQLDGREIGRSVRKFSINEAQDNGGTSGFAS